MATCADCKLWAPPAPMDPKHEAIVLRHGQSRDGGCHRYPVVTKTGAAHWCGEFRQGPRRVPEAEQKQEAEPKAAAENGAPA